MKRLHGSDTHILFVSISIGPSDVARLKICCLYIAKRDSFVATGYHKKGYEEIPLIVLSSLSPYLAGVNQKELGIMDWIEKPFSPKHLLSIIDRISGRPA